MAHSSSQAPAPTSPARATVYQTITCEIFAAIEREAATPRGTAPSLPWHHDGSASHRPVNALSRRPYRSVNILALWASAEAAGFPQGLWATYRQWSELGAQV